MLSCIFSRLKWMFVIESRRDHAAFDLARRRLESPSLTPLCVRNRRNSSMSAGLYLMFLPTFANFNGYLFVHRQISNVVGATPNSSAASGVVSNFLSSTVIPSLLKLCETSPGSLPQ
jgi:hypothetical protein